MEVGIGFMMSLIYHPAMKIVRPVRKKLKVKTVFNILGPMLNPAKVPFAVVGVYNEDIATFIDPADMDSLKKALDENNVSLFFTETPTNPFLRCINIKLVSELCHQKGALVCIDGTFATPVNQKALTLGADIVVNYGTKFIAGHNDVVVEVFALLSESHVFHHCYICTCFQVISGCVSGPEELIVQVRKFHHLNGGVLDPHAAYMVLRGMKTLHLRVQYQNSLAFGMAQFLEEHPKVAGRALGELVRKLGERVLPSIIPILSSGLRNPSTSRRKGFA